MSDRKQFTRVKGPFSKTMYIPRAGKIRLGLKVQSKNNPAKTHPKNVDYFVVPEAVAKIYGGEPTELRIMFPTEDETQFFPQRLEWWRAGGLACHGNNEEAQRWDPATKAWIDRACPCEHFKSDENPTGECTERAHLLCLLPDVSMGSCYQIDTGSYHGVVNINSMIENVRRLVGRVSYVPLLLRRVVREITREGKREKKALLELAIDPSYDTPEGINLMREQTRRILDARTLVKIEGPKEEAPSDGPVDLIEDDELPEPPDETVQPPSETIPAPHGEPPRLGLTLNPDGAERERQARLTETPPQIADLLPDMPPAKGLGASINKTHGRQTDGEAAWNMWHNGALQDMDTYERTCRQLNIPMGKPINRALRGAFKKAFDERIGMRA
jgi:hypothetical protein